MSKDSGDGQKSAGSSVVDSAALLAILTTIVFVWGLAYMKGYSGVFGLPLYEFSLSAAMAIVGSHWINISAAATGLGFLLIVMRASPKYLRKRKGKLALEVAELCEGKTPEAKLTYLLTCFLMLYVTGLYFQHKGSSTALRYGEIAPVVALSGSSESVPDGTKLLSMDSESYYLFYGEVTVKKRPTIVILNRADVSKLQFTRK